MACNSLKTEPMLLIHAQAGMLSVDYRTAVAFSNYIIYLILTKEKKFLVHRIDSCSSLS